MLQGLTFRAVKDRVAIYFPKGGYDPRYYYELDNPLAIPVVDNMLVVPLIFHSGGQSEVLGALQFYNRINPDQEFYTIEPGLCDAIADLVAGVLNITNATAETWSIVYEFKKRAH